MSERRLTTDHDTSTSFEALPMFTTIERTEANFATATTMMDALHFYEPNKNI